MKIIAPNKQYTGVSASVSFVRGVGETDDPVIIAWFKTHGYDVVEAEEPEEESPDQKPKKEPKKEQVAADTALKASDNPEKPKK